jgi:hypothetical protein
MSGYGLHLIQYPSGNWGYAGSVPVKLAMIHKSGRELTEKELQDLPYMSCPSMFGITTRSWTTKAEAERAAAMLDPDIEILSIRPNKKTA